jgi:Flp pilus assembly protein TadB
LIGPESAKADLRRAAYVAALAAYIGVAAALYQADARVQATGKTLAEKHSAVESRLLGLSSSVQARKTEAPEERREIAREYDAWKEQSSAWSIKRWFVLAFATLAFLPVVLWGLQSWGIWARDRRLNRSTDV